MTVDRVALILPVDDPMRTRTGVRWDFEDQDVACPNPTDTGHLTQRRLKRVLVTAVENCGLPNCEDLTEQSGGELGWPESCDVREAALDLDQPTLPPDARCTEWFRWSSNCQVVYEPPDDPEEIPPPTITYVDGGVYSWSRPCSWCRRSSWRC